MMVSTVSQGIYNGQASPVDILILFRQRRLAHPLKKNSKDMTTASTMIRESE
jgi:hypothetical protein